MPYSPPLYLSIVLLLNMHIHLLCLLSYDSLHPMITVVSMAYYNNTADIPSHLTPRYRHGSVAEQGPVSAATTILPGLDCITFEQLTDKLAAPAPPLPIVLMCDCEHGHGDDMDVDRDEHIRRQFSHGKGCTRVNHVEDPCLYHLSYVLNYNVACLYLLQRTDCSFSQTRC